jgi:hypothetical protein
MASHQSGFTTAEENGELEVIIGGEAQNFLVSTLSADACQIVSFRFALVPRS